MVSTTIGAQKNKYEKLYQEVENIEGITTISINKAMFNMLGNLDLDSELKNFDQLLKQVNSVKIIILDKDEALKKAKSELEKAKDKLNLAQAELLKDATMDNAEVEKIAKKIASDESKLKAKEEVINNAKVMLEQSLNQLNLEELISINNEGNKIKFYTETSKNEMFKNLILNINNDNNLLYMILDGTISANDLNQIIINSDK